MRLLCGKGVGMQKSEKEDPTSKAGASREIVATPGAANPTGTYVYIA
jgi:hypothetical protein